MKQSLPSTQYKPIDFHHKLWAATFALVFAYVSYAHWYFGNLDLVIALSGFSALDFSNSVLNSEFFRGDFPGGAAFAGNSALPWVYPALATLGIDPEIVLHAMIAMEIAVLVIGAVLLYQTLFPEKSPVVALLLLTLLAASGGRAGNLANFGSPFFHGQFYGFADGLQLAAIAYYLRSKHSKSAVLAFLCFLVHPIKAGFAFVFIGAAQLVSKPLNQRFLMSFGGAALLCCAWYVMTLRSTPTDQLVSHEDFFFYIPLLNSHWFPARLGIFSNLHWMFATPFFGATLILFIQIIRSEVIQEKKLLLTGITSLLLLAMLGVIVANNEVSPILVKICLQRASVTLLALTIVVTCGQMISDFNRGRWFLAGLAIVICYGLFTNPGGWSFLAAIIFSAVTLFDLYRADKRTEATAVLLITAIYVIYLFILADQELLTRGQVQTQRYQLILPALVTLVAIISLRHLSDQLRKNVLPWLLLTPVVFGAIQWTIANRSLDSRYLDRASDYKNVQLWANKSTETSDIFMVDPCLSYGWRDYSVRSSFGTIHEWYKTGWLYSGNRRILDEGIKRGQLLGIDVQALVSKNKNYTPSWIHSTFCQVASESYYANSGKALSKAAADYGIAYVILDKDKKPRYGNGPNWPVTYEGEFFQVLSPPGVTSEPN